MSVQAGIRVEVDEDRLEVGAGVLLVVVVVIIVLLRVGEFDLEVGEEVLLLHDRDIDRRRQAVIADVDEAVVPLELDGDRLAERIVVVLVLDPAADRLDELEELVGLPLGSLTTRTSE